MKCLPWTCWDVKPDSASKAHALERARRCFLCSHQPCLLGGLSKKTVPRQTSRSKGPDPRDAGFWKRETPSSRWPKPRQQRLTSARSSQQKPDRESLPLFIRNPDMRLVAYLVSCPTQHATAEKSSHDFGSSITRPGRCSRKH